MRRSRKWNATLETAQRGEVKHSFRCRGCLTSPVAPNSEGSVPLFDSARQPLLEGGDKNPPQFRFISNHQRPHYSGSFPTINVGQQPLQSPNQ